jgi:hypothetical protein
MEKLTIILPSDAGIECEEDEPGIVKITVDRDMSGAPTFDWVCIELGKGDVQLLRDWLTSWLQREEAGGTTEGGAGPRT